MWIVPKFVDGIDEIRGDLQQDIRAFLGSVIVIIIFMAHCLASIRGCVTNTCEIGMIGGIKRVDRGGITRLDELWEFFSDQTGQRVHFILNLGEFTGDMGSVAIEDWSVTVHDLTWMVHYDKLVLEPLSISECDVLSVGSVLTSLDVSDGETFDDETNSVIGYCLPVQLVIYHDRFDLV